MASEPEILFDRKGRAGLVTLNRPKALNALSYDMVMLMAEHLAIWRDDPAIGVVVVRGAGRAFCAGGDVRAAYEAGRAGPSPAAFFRDEYRLNAAIKHFPKPYVALVDGFVMGGGVGISAHGSHRVFAENAVFSMPETGIGFFPDVGSSYLLARMPGESGLYAALAAARLGRGDCLHAGIATHAAPAANFDAIVDALAEGDDADRALAPFLHGPVAPETLRELNDPIAAIFGTGTVETILSRLDEAEGPHAPWAERTAADIRAKSPTSLVIALKQIRAARTLDFDDCIRLDYRIASQILDGHDFYEGVRAALVDKDKAPRWRPDTLSAVDPRVIEAHFGVPSDGDFTLP
ncbi:enoyl-CoA hydratase/isomerase family protein [Kaistia dalseonensis]|uniref:3-hydroxyisobutyryl-CoA hydrolase n=1 Tax=Kaistia dalseonensis TaxID=410840 RepID=A0ABU0H3A0_9HYPH|nr:enoyl-CoA hydratase/isomerase family protein [Kaistia dalseonensis]MCX5493813.1 enoyl-CoA hydratase/isomerase family protein [Kaistia dalseonensis]MDQ0436378.1 enoyl-CoA hydratase [Kaistia dalseonensis]